MSKIRKTVGRVITSSLLLALVWLGGAEAQQQITGQPFACSADNIGATLTELAGCAVLTAPTGVSSWRYYITDVVAQSTTSTGGQFILRSGTGTNCATGTTSVLPSAATAARLSAPANTVEATHLQFKTPLPLTSGHALCVLGVATNTTTLQVTGIIAP